MNFLQELKKVKARDTDESYRCENTSIEYHNICSGPNNVFAFGNAHYGRLGDGQQQFNRMTPNRIKSLDGSTIKAVKITSAHTLVLLGNGVVLSFGKCHFGQLGLGHNWMDAFTPQQIDFKICIKCIATGTHHSLAVAENGNVFAWGCNFNGALGLGDEISRSRPELLTSIGHLHCTKVAGGDYHSLAVIESPPIYQVYSWGKGAQGQLGLGTYENHLLPQAIENLNSILIDQIIAASDMSAVITQSQQTNIESSDLKTVNIDDKDKNSFRILYAWGSNSHLQLGCGPANVILSREDVATLNSGMIKDRNPGICNITEIIHPMRDDVIESEGVRYWAKVASGGQHCLAIDNSGTVYGWGYGAAFGIPDLNVCIGIPTQISNTELLSAGENNIDTYNAVDVACGTRHSLVCTESGICLSIGINNSGQLGVGDVVNRSVLTPLDSTILGGRAVCCDGGTNSSIIVVSIE